MNRKLRILGLAALALALAVSGAWAAGTTYTWTGASGTDKKWSTAGNWTPNGTPGSDPADVVIISQDATIENNGVAYPGDLAELRLVGGVTLAFEESAHALTVKNVLVTEGKAVINTTSGTHFVVSDTTQVSFDIAKDASLSIKGNGVKGVGGNLTLHGEGTLKLEAPVTDASGLKIEGGATLVLASAAALPAVNSAQTITKGNLVVDKKDAFETTMTGLTMKEGDLTLNAKHSLRKECIAVTMEKGVLTVNGKEAIEVATLAFDGEEFTATGDAKCVVTLNEKGKLDVNAPRAVFKELKKGTKAGSVVVKDGASLYVGAHHDCAIEVPVTGKVGIFADTAAHKVTVTSKVDEIEAHCVSFVMDLELGADADVAKVHMRTNAAKDALGKLKVTENSSIGTLKFDTVATGLKVDVAAGKTLTVDKLVKAGGKTLADGDVILEQDTGLGELALKDGEGATKGVFSVKKGTLRVEKAEALLGATEVKLSNL